MVEKIRVMQMVDSLSLGGAETVAVNLANLFQTHPQIESYLCVTRKMGLLVDRLDPGLHVLTLDRKTTFDLKAIFLLRNYLFANKIQIIHAHGSAIFLSTVIKCFIPSIHIIWHIHQGGIANHKGCKRIIENLLEKFTSGVIVVNQDLLKNFSHASKGSHIWYIPNFISTSIKVHDIHQQLPNIEGKKIICVANLRPEKDHLTLIKAMKKVVEISPGTHLLLAGSVGDKDYEQRLLIEIENLGLKSNISMLGARADIGYLLNNSNIAVLSSLYEGFPLVILEYGQAGLPVVATRVGQIPKILDEGNYGLLVEPSNPDQLAGALTKLLLDESLCKDLGSSLKTHVEHSYSPDAAVDKITSIYRTLLN